MENRTNLLWLSNTRQISGYKKINENKAQLLRHNINEEWTKYKKKVEANCCVHLPCNHMAWKYYKRALARTHKHTHTKIIIWRKTTMDIGKLTSTEYICACSATEREKDTEICHCAIEYRQNERIGSTSRSCHVFRWVHEHTVYVFGRQPGSVPRWN